MARTKMTARKVSAAVPTRASAKTGAAVAKRSTEAETKVKAELLQAVLAAVNCSFDEWTAAHSGDPHIVHVLTEMREDVRGRVGHPK